GPGHPPGGEGDGALAGGEHGGLVPLLPHRHQDLPGGHGLRGPAVAGGLADPGHPGRPAVGDRLPPEGCLMIPLRYNVRNLAVRKTTSAAAVLGLALVVFVFSAVQMLSNGITRTLGRAASPDVAVVLRKGSTAELESTIDAPNVNLVLNSDALPAPASGARGVA